jgi:hypothetical protein
MRRLLRAGCARLRRLLPRGRAEARLATLAQALLPALATPATAPLTDRVLQIRLLPDGLLLDPPPPGLSAHDRLALQATLAAILCRETLPRGAHTAWISVPSRPDARLYLHVADARGRHVVVWSEGRCGLLPEVRQTLSPETAR